MRSNIWCLVKEHSVTNFQVWKITDKSKDLSKWIVKMFLVLRDVSLPDSKGILLGTSMISGKKTNRKNKDKIVTCHPEILL